MLRCDMKKDCVASVAMLDEKGYVYCAGHGVQRRNSGVRCRKLRPAELAQLERGEPLKKY